MKKKYVCFLLKMQRPRFLIGVDQMTLQIINPPQSLRVKEEIINRRPVYMRTQPKERTADPVKAYITQRTDNIKNMITSSGLKVDMSHLQEKLFPIEYQDEHGNTQSKKVRLLDMTLPIEERLKAIQAAIASKDLNPSEKQGLSALVGIEASQLAMLQLSTDQRDLLAMVMNQIAPVGSYTDIGLDRFHDLSTYEPDQARIKTFLIMKKNDITGSDGGKVDIDTIQLYMRRNKDDLLDLKDFRFIPKVQAQSEYPEDYNVWEIKVLKSGSTPSPQHMTPIRHMTPAYKASFILQNMTPSPNPGQNRKEREYIILMTKHAENIDLTWPLTDPKSKDARSILMEYFNDQPLTEDRRAELQDLYYKYVQYGENRLARAEV